MTEMKPGWRLVKLDDVVDVITDYWDRDPSRPERFVAGEHIDEGSLRVSRWGMTNDDLVPPTFNRRFRAGDVLFHSRNLRKLAQPNFGGITGEKIFVLRARDPQVLIQELLPFLLQAKAFSDYTERMWAGSTNRFLNKGPLVKYEFVLPPLEEQRRFSALLNSTWDAIEALAIASVSAEQALMATSKFYFEHLFSECPVEIFGKVVNTLDPNPSHRYPAYVDDGVPMVATQDFHGSDSYTFAKAKHVPVSTWEEQNLRCSFCPSDVIFARKGVIGLARRYGKEQKAFSHTVVVMKPGNGRISPDYLLWLVRSDRFMTVLRREMNSNSGVPTLGVKTIESVPVPVPDESSQDALCQALHQIDAGRTTLGARSAELRAIHCQALQQLCSNKTDQ